MLDESLFQSTLDQLKQHLLNVTFYFQGEPFLNKSFLGMVSYAHSKNLFTFTSTNGHFLDRHTAEETVRSGLSKIIVSLDGIAQDTYEKYRIGGDLKKVLDGIKELAEAKKRLGSLTPFIEVQMVVFSHNETEIDAVKSLKKTLGINKVSLKSAQIYDHMNGSELLPSDEQLSRYSKSGNGFKIKNKLYDHCWRLWNSSVITWDGRVVPCCFDKDAMYKMGDVTKTDFMQVWRSESYKKFRGQLLKQRKSIAICNNCSEGTKVWI